MQTAVKHWFLHFDYPHTLHDAKVECIDMVHDSIFWIMMGSFVLAITMASVFASAMLLGTSSWFPLIRAFPYTPHLT